MPALFDEFIWMLEHGCVLRLGTRSGGTVLIGREDAVAKRLNKQQPAKARWVLLKPTGAVAVQQVAHLFHEVLKLVEPRQLRATLHQHRYDALFPRGSSLGWHTHGQLALHGAL